jgi:hypothetical protein
MYFQDTTVPLQKGGIKEYQGRLRPKQDQSLARQYSVLYLHTWHLGTWWDVGAKGLRQPRSYGTVLDSAVLQFSQVESLLCNSPRPVLDTW